jgi:Flp pilus assembly protein TadD
MQFPAGRAVRPAGGFPRRSAARSGAGRAGGYDRFMSRTWRLPGAVAASTALIAVLSLAGCATLPASEAARQVTEADLLSGRAINAPPYVQPDSQPLVLDADMLRFLAQSVPPGDDNRRMRMLMKAILTDAGIRLEYDERTRTAAGAFHDRLGNCMSFTSLFVAMARQIGLRASFQEVDVPPDWSLRDGAWVLSRHVNAHVRISASVEHVVDFNMAEFRAGFPRRVISDERALAHFHNNLGVERLQAGERMEAWRHLRAAVAADPAFTPAWTSLGTLYWRAGRVAEAEASYLQALRVDATETVALSNLAGLHRSRRDAAAAAWFERRVQQHRRQNPYYRAWLAQQAYERGDDAGALAQLRAAIRIRPQEETFHSLQGMVYARLGDRPAASAAFARARDLAADEQREGTYVRKLEVLAEDAHDAGGG